MLRAMRGFNEGLRMNMCHYVSHNVTPILQAQLLREKSIPCYRHTKENRFLICFLRLLASLSEQRFWMRRWTNRGGILPGWPGSLDRGYFGCKGGDWERSDVYDMFIYNSTSGGEWVRCIDSIRPGHVDERGSALHLMTTRERNLEWPVSRILL